MKIEHKNPDSPTTLKALAERHKRDGLTAVEEHGVIYEPIDVKTILTRNPNPSLRHYWSINPYRGCQFGCTYCFARYTASFIEMHNTFDFERRIFYKRNAAAVTAKLRDADFYGKPILLGAGTDPWQPAEARFEITRGILEALTRFPSLDMFCLTKSSLIRRDADIFAKLVKAGIPVRVGFSITTVDEALARKMEPQAARPKERFKAMRALADVGVGVGIMMMPVVPLLTDTAENLEALLTEAKAHGAQFAREAVLHLRSIPKQHFMPWLEQAFPHLARSYHVIYDQASHHHHTYQSEIRTRVSLLKEKIGFTEFEMVHRQPRRGEQLKLL